MLCVRHKNQPNGVLILCQAKRTHVFKSPTIVLGPFKGNGNAEMGAPTRS